MPKNKYFYLVSITLGVLLLDQLTKIWVRVNIPEGMRRIDVIPGYFRLVHVENRGAAWGILADSAYRIPFFIVATLIAFGVIGVYFSKIAKDQLMLASAISLILGGAIGNFIDRLVYQSVTDFLDFYVASQPMAGWLRRTFGSNSWPSFNVADMAIVGGLVLVMYDMLVLEPSRERAAQLAREGSTPPDPAQTSNGGNG